VTIQLILAFSCNTRIHHELENRRKKMKNNKDRKEGKNARKSRK
jgi:hypothetical protein